MTFNQLVEIEPELRALLREAQHVVPTEPNFCANRVWYDRFKPRLVELVGWETKNCNAELRTPGAYDLAYETIYNALPDCKHPGPFC